MRGTKLSEEEIVLLITHSKVDALQDVLIRLHPEIENELQEIFVDKMANHFDVALESNQQENKSSNGFLTRLLKKFT